MQGFLPPLGVECHRCCLASPNREQVGSKTHGITVALHHAVPCYAALLSLLPHLCPKQPAQPNAAGLLGGWVQGQRRQPIPLEHHPDGILRLLAAL